MHKFLLNLFNNLFVVSVSIPNGNLVTVSTDGQNNPVYFVLRRELFSNHGKYEVLPQLICKALRYPEGPSTAILVGFIFPHGFDPVDEKLHIGSLRELIWSLKERVDLPKFFSGPKFSYCFVFLLPFILLGGYTARDGFYS